MLCKLDSPTERIRTEGGAVAVDPHNVGAEVGEYHCKEQGGQPSSGTGIIQLSTHCQRKVLVRDRRADDEGGGELPEAARVR